MDEYRIPRALVTEEVSELWLVAFWDGSLDAHATCIYARTSEVDMDGQESYDARLIFGKSRVAPLAGTTISKMELQGLVQCTRSVLKVVRALDQRVARVVIAGDSMCALMAIRREGAIYRPYFQNRVAEVNANMAELDALVDTVEPPLKIDGPANPADICTRRRARPQDVSGDSEWQSGPSFLRLDRGDWPLSTPDDPSAVPEQELRRTAVRVGQVDGQNARGLSTLIDRLLHRVSKLPKVIATLARCLRMMGSGLGREEACRIHPEPRDLEAARKLLLYHQQSSTRAKLAKGELESLSAASIKGHPSNSRGLVVTRGRVPSDLWKRLTGMPVLPILDAASPLARMIVEEAHRKDHRKDVGTLMADSRRHAWIVGARRLIKSVVKSCMWCRRAGRKRLEQIMGDIGEENLVPTRPFQNITLDLMGPLSTRGMGGNSRAVSKCWCLVVVCSVVKAVSLWLMGGYSTEDFMVAFGNHCAIYGVPSLVVSDRGTQLRAAAGSVLDWEEVRQVTAGEGTTWRFIPAATPWRVGLAERVVGLAKVALMKQITAGSLLNFAQLEAMLFKVSAILNSRPLSARSFSEGDFQAITPRDLLLGVAPALSPEEGLRQACLDLSPERLGRLTATVEERVQAWWEQFFADVFPLLVPRRTMMREHTALSLGDIVLLQYAVKHGKDRYRLARVLDLHPDAHGVVRTVSVGVRSNRRGAREPREVNRAGLELMLAPVQRLVLVLPAAEQPEEILRELRDRATFQPGQEEAVIPEGALPRRQGDRRSARIQARRLAGQAAN